MYATEIRDRLRQLAAERALVLTQGPATDLALLVDLEEEIDAARDAYVGAAVTEIAILRAELSGRLYG